MVPVGWIASLLVLSGCTSDLPAPVYLRSGDPSATFTELVTRNPYGVAPDVDVLTLPDGAREMLSAQLRRKHTQRLKVEAIGALFMPDGKLGMQYETLSTGTAAETFERRTGNCLAYTHLFIAMARSVGIDARYREVLGVPQWETSGEFVMLNHHIAAYGELGKKGTYVADFGFLYAGERTFGRLISDERARAQHFNNLGARELVNGDVADAVRMFARGLTIDRNLGYLWTNLGTAYLRDGDPKHAELALHEALRLTPWDVTALNQLTRLYEMTGHTDLATRYRRRSESARRQNPYLQFTWALEARDAGRLAVAVDYLRQATHTEPDEMYFWLELAKTYVMENKRKDAQRSLLRAEALIVTAEQRLAFTSTVEDLMALRGGAPGSPEQVH